MTEKSEKPVAIVTGASSGIGRATAIFFAGKGYDLSLSGRNEAEMATVVRDCEKLGAKVTTTMGDLRDHVVAHDLVKHTTEHFGRINTLINAAGILISGTVAGCSVTDYDKIFDINFPGVTYYCMSKAALDQFTKCLALELAADGVRVNSVNPGVIVSKIHRRSGMNDEQYKEFISNSKKTHALGRVGKADEVARAIHFLASAESSFTTGHQLMVDGGRHIMTPR